MFSKSLLLFIFILSFEIYSQKSNNSITGRITSKESKEPISNANVFLAYTMVGSSTDQNGNYTIRNVSPGKYWLVISHLNYKTINVKIDVKKNRNYSYNFELQPKIFQFRPIRITAEGKTEWEKHLETFEEVFLGTSDFAENTFIQNATELDFKETDETLFAKSQKPLIIFNRSLGYKIEYSLLHFEYINNDYVKYAGFPKFSLLVTTNPDTLELWKINRMKAYFGSLRHFLQTICKNYLITGQNLDKPELKINYSDSTERGYKLEYSEDNFLFKNGFEVLYKSFLGERFGINPIVYLVNTNQYISPAINENEMYLKFNNFFEVRYQNPDEDKFPVDDDIKRSWIKLEKDSVLIDKLGRYYETFSIKSFGFWSTQRLADTLPYEYVIPDSMFVY